MLFRSTSDRSEAALFATTIPSPADRWSSSNKTVSNGGVNSSMVPTTTSASPSSCMPPVRRCVRCAYSSAMGARAARPTSEASLPVASSGRRLDLLHAQPEIRQSLQPHRFGAVSNRPARHSVGHEEVGIVSGNCDLDFTSAAIWTRVCIG